MLGLFAAYAPIRGTFRYMLLGAMLGAAAGFSISYIPSLAQSPTNETWRAFRYAAELALYYSGLVCLVLWPDDRGLPYGTRLARAALFALGFCLMFFDARAAGFLVHDIGRMAGALPMSTALGIAGLATGLVALAALHGLIARARLERAMSMATLLMLVGAVRFASGGVGEVEDGSILAAMQSGFEGFLQGTVRDLQSAFMLAGHEFIAVPWAGLADYFASDRMALALLMAFIMAPPAYAMIWLYSTPEPMLMDAHSHADRRLKKATFRTDMTLRSVPILLSMVIIFIVFHAVNVSLNPMYEPVPMTVRASELDSKTLRIPLVDKMGDMSDKKIRKYVYYSGTAQVIFLALEKPDGSIGVALDECEICNPAEWNKAAQGYAQRGENLVCKYCMTPIASSTINKPGGCNPIPIPFKVAEGEVVIDISELVRVHTEAKAMQKQGTHF